jgi:hypothetical protein
MADRIAGLGYGEPVQANPQLSSGWAGWRRIKARPFDLSMESVVSSLTREARQRIQPWTRITAKLRSALRPEGVLLGALNAARSYLRSA